MNYKLLPALSLLILFTTAGYGQACSSIGLGLNANRPLSSDYKVGFGLDLQPNIRLSKKFALVPELGFKKINSNGRFVYKDGIITPLFRI